jgi:hypothetical protein
LSVQTVSSTLKEAGEMLANMSVLASFSRES